jgi:hypothetical protein
MLLFPDWIGLVSVTKDRIPANGFVGEYPRLRSIRLVNIIERSQFERNENTYIESDSCLSHTYSEHKSALSPRFG